MNAVAEMPAPLVFTDSAAAKVSQLIDEEGNAAIKGLMSESQRIYEEPLL